MNGKTVLILEHLLDGRPHKLRDLAQRLEISVRLVRYEMQEVDAFLRREGFPEMCIRDRCSTYAMPRKNRF